jgi:hypothetical protein
MQLHTDQGYVVPPWPEIPLACNVAWLLDDFTAEPATCPVRTVMATDQLNIETVDARGGWLGRTAFQAVKPVGFGRQRRG